MIHHFDPAAVSDAVTDVFRRGHALQVPWNETERERVACDMAEVANYLAQFPPTPSFGGINELDADRQTLWVASTGLEEPLHTDAEALTRFDGDTEGGERGLETLRRESSVAAALNRLKQRLDHALQISARSIGLNRDLPSELFEKITVRYRAIRYAPVDRELAGIGLHPDGNVLSALITDQPGLVITDRDGVARPKTDGTIVMPGSILYRWSDGYFKPTFHTVEIRRGDAAKCTIVGFLNFPDHLHIPRSARWGGHGDFLNEVQRHKEDDMNEAGDLAELWTALSK